MSGGCDCVEKVNAKLAARNTRLTQAVLFGPDTTTDSDHLMLETEQITFGRGQPKKVSMFLTHCPFCGRKYDALPA